MSVESWAKRASGLLVPTMSFANPLGRWQPCAGSCCVEDPCLACVPISSTPDFMEVTLSGIPAGFACPFYYTGDITELNATHLLPHRLFNWGTCLAGMGNPGFCEWCGQVKFVDCYYRLALWVVNVGATNTLYFTIEQDSDVAKYKVFSKAGVSTDCSSYSDELLTYAYGVDLTSIPTTTVVTVSSV